MRRIFAFLVVGIALAMPAKAAEGEVCHKAAELQDLYSGHTLQIAAINDVETAQAFARAFLEDYLSTIVVPEKVGSVVLVRVDDLEGAIVVFFKQDGCFMATTTGRVTEKNLISLLKRAVGTY